MKFKTMEQLSNLSYVQLWNRQTKLSEWVTKAGGGKYRGKTAEDFMKQHDVITQVINEKTASIFNRY